VRLIVDTDIQTDCDDVGALAVLHALADLGECRILATVVSVRNDWSVRCTDAVNTYFGRPDLPIGVLKGTGVQKDSKFARGVAEGFPHDIRPDAAPDATALYRRTLAAEPDGGVVILTLGYMTAVRNLLESGPDDASPLSGAELVRKKVKLWVCMGGNFPQGDGDNVNFTRDRESAVRAVRGWPGPIMFCGREIGHSMRAGAGLAKVPADNPVRRAYELYFGGAAKDRHCADPAAVLYAVRGAADYWTERTGGVMDIRDDATFRFRETPGGKHGYLVAKKPAAEIAAELERLMMHIPGKRAVGE
jgi:hypothetical protein